MADFLSVRTSGESEFDGATVPVQHVGTCEYCMEEIYSDRAYYVGEDDSGDTILLHRDCLRDWLDTTYRDETDLAKRLGFTVPDGFAYGAAE